MTVAGRAIGVSVEGRGGQGPGDTRPLLRPAQPAAARTPMRQPDRFAQGRGDPVRRVECRYDHAGRILGV